MAGYTCKLHRYNDHRFREILTLNKTFETPLGLTYLPVACHTMKYCYIK